MLSRALLTIHFLTFVACGSQTPAAKPTPESAGPQGQASATDPWEEARQRGVDFRALGQEPGWYLEIDNERSIKLVYDYGERQAIAAVPVPRRTPGTVTYSATTDAHAIAITIVDRVCHDGMSGFEFPATVTVSIDGRELRGCGRALHATNANWSVSTRGVGPVRIGMTRSEAEAALEGALKGPGNAGECSYLTSSRAPQGVLLMLVDDRIVRVDVTRPGVFTDKGIEVGATEARVHEAYRGAVATSVHKYTDGHYLTVTLDPSHRIVFETDGQRVTRYRAGRVPEVEWVEGCS